MPLQDSLLTMIRNCKIKAILIRGWLKSNQLSDEKSIQKKSMAVAK